MPSSLLRLLRLLRPSRRPSFLSAHVGQQRRGSTGRLARRRQRLLGAGLPGNPPPIAFKHPPPRPPFIPTAFIKWGQWAATRHDLFPPDFCAELELLHTQASAAGSGPAGGGCLPGRGET
jgi:hypothetical protein